MTKLQQNLFKKAEVPHWKIAIHSTDCLKIKTRSFNNVAGFVSLEVSINAQENVEFTLVVNSKKVCRTIYKDLNQKSEQKDSFFKHRKLAPPLKQSKLIGTMYQLESENPKMMSLIVDYINKQLPFTYEQSYMLELLIPEKQVVQEKSRSCAIM